jgi:hypothetical protein
MKMLEQFKRYLKKLNKRYEECKDQKERERLRKKIEFWEELISDYEGVQ